MPTIRGRSVFASGAVVRVRLSLSAQEVAARHSARLVVPQPVEVDAVVDTGAQATCVDRSLVGRLGLPPLGGGLVHLPAAGGVGVAADYDAGLTLLHPSGHPQDHLVLPDLLVTGLPLATLGYDLLVGRDVLTRCVLVYNGPVGRFTLRY